MSEALIIGAGISGLAAGWAFRRAGVPVRLLEAGTRPGGKIRTARMDGFCFELGPQAVQSSSQLWALARAADAEGPLAEATGKLYVVHRGRLAAFPSGLREAWSSPILSKKAVLRCLTEPFRGRGPGPHESVTRFVNRRLGKETARFADALVLGLFAGDPDELAMGYAFPRIYRWQSERGGVLRTFLARRKQAANASPAQWHHLVGSSQGLGEWVERLAAPLEVAEQHEVTEVVPANGGFAVRGRSPDGSFELHTARLVSALPIRAAARVLSALGPVEALMRVPAAPVAVLNLGFKRGQVRHSLDGFGFLSPHHEDRMLLGCLFSSTLFPNRAPDAHVALTVMAGGRRRRDEVELSDTALLERVLYELESLLGVEGEPVVSKITRWQGGIAQATARMGEVHDAVRALELAHPGLSVLGDGIHGPGIFPCVKAAWESDVGQSRQAASRPTE